MKKGQDFREWQLGNIATQRQRLEQQGLTGHVDHVSLDKDRQRKGVPQEKKYAKGKRTKALRSRVTSIEQLKTPILTLSFSKLKL